MKNIILSTFLLFFSYTVISQTFNVIDGDTINYLDKNGQKQGKWIEYKNELKFIYNYRNGKLHGNQKAFDGKRIFEEINFKNGLRDGLYITYIVGTKDDVKIYRNDTLNGEAIKYSYGKISKKGYYKNGKLDGKVESWYKNGSTKRIEYWKYGKILHSKNFYKNGQLYFESILDSFQMKKYYKSGKLKFESTSKMQIIYNKNGDTVDVIKYKPENMIGHDTIKGYTKENRKKYYYETPFFNGKEHGLSKTYYPNGKIYNETHIIDGIVIKSKGYYNNGNIKTVTTYNGDVMILKSYDKKGKLKYKRSFNLNEINKF